MKAIFVIFILFIGIVFSLNLLLPDILQKKPSKSTPTPTAVSMCEALHVISPKTNAVVQSPLQVEVMVDNTQKGCHWTVFEAQAGSIKLFDETGTLLGNGTLQTTENWMQEAPLRYSGKIIFSHPSSPRKANLVLLEENPSGNSANQTITIPLILK